MPNLAEHTAILSPLTTKECNKNFPSWTGAHHTAFEAVKALVVSADCLTVIDHDNPGNNKIFVTCNASDYRTGAVLSWGPTWETARPVAFDSMQLKGAQKNYPVHEKELLSIMRTLKKWRSDLLGSPIHVYTNHRTLENFETQKDLSRRQARWQEFMSQYEMDIIYIRGEDNTVADALSRLPLDDTPVTDIEEEHLTPWKTWANMSNSVNAVLSINADKSFLDSLKCGYDSDPFCRKFILSQKSINSIRMSNDLHWVQGMITLIKVFKKNVTSTLATFHIL